MGNPTMQTTPSVEHLLAELTEAAYGVALRHGIQGAFIDVELELWRELRTVFNRHEEARA